MIIPGFTTPHSPSKNDIGSRIQTCPIPPNAHTQTRFPAPIPRKHRIPLHFTTPILFFCPHCARYISKRHVVVTRSLSGAPAFSCPTCEQTLHIEGLLQRKTLFAISTLFLLCVLVFLASPAQLVAPLTIQRGQMFYVQNTRPLVRYYYLGIMDSHMNIRALLLGGSTRGRNMGTALEISGIIPITNQQFHIHDLTFHIENFNPRTQEITLTWTRINI